jgi:integrase
MQGYLEKYHKWRLDQFTRQDMVNIFKDISERSKAQANSTMRMLHALWNWAAFTYVDENETSLIKDNPVRIIKEKKLQHYIRSRTTHLDEDDIGPFIRALLNFEDETRWQGKAFSNNGRDLYFMLLFTGMRLNEGQSLDWNSNINLDKGMLVVIDPKNGDDHELPLGDFLHEMLKVRAKYKRDNWVYPSRQNEGTHISNMRANLDNINKIAGTKITAHDMRRTYASVVNNLDYGFATIKRLLNHRDSTQQKDQTLRYIQLSLKRLRLAMNEIEDAYFEYAGITKEDAIEKIKASM